MSREMTTEKNSDTTLDNANNRVPEMRRVKTIHFVGIGGAGMKAIKLPVPILVKIQWLNA